MLYFEDGVNFADRRRRAEEFSLSGWFLSDWLVAWLQQMRGIPTLFDYATRISMSRDILENLNRNHKKACKLSLEKVLYNLVPNPEQVVLATQEGSGMIPQQEIRPLQDEVGGATDGILRRLRYQLLTRALELYCEIGLEDIAKDLEEETPPDYKGWFEHTNGTIQDPLSDLVKFRKELFIEFPPEELRSVCADVLERAENEYDRHEHLAATKRGNELEKKIKETVTKINGTLREIMSKAYDQRNEMTRAEQKYLALVRNLKVLKNMLESHIDPAVSQTMDTELQAFEDSVKARYMPEEIFPAEVLEDMDRRLRVYRDGNL